MIDPKNPNHWFLDCRPPSVILDKDQTLALLTDEAASERFMQDREHWTWKSQYLCDFMDAMEKTSGYVYNLQAVRAFEKEHGLSQGPENGTPLSILVYNAQRYRRADALVAADWRPGRDLMTAGAKIVVYGSSLLGHPVTETLTVREVAGQLYAFRPRQRKRAMVIQDMPCKLAGAPDLPPKSDGGIKIINGDAHSKLQAV